MRHDGDVNDEMRMMNQLAEFLKMVPRFLPESSSRKESENDSNADANAQRPEKIQIWFLVDWPNFHDRIIAGDD